MISRLPRWIEVGGFWLAAIAGSVNSIGLLGFKHQAVSHLTGTSTLLSLSAANLDVIEGSHLTLVVVSFVLGAMLSGFILDNAVLRLGRRYSFALLIEGVLLLLAMAALQQGSVAGHFFASAACGLQNGMVSTYSGAVIRTTHVSGLFTDIGTMLGARLRGHELDRRRMTLYTLLISGFLAGGSLGAIGFQRLQFASLAIPACGALALAGLNLAYRRWSRSKACPAANGLNCSPPAEAVS
jgi:uncharacterized membrane protein YoaK (UPF0700 family)